VFVETRTTAPLRCRDYASFADRASHIEFNVASEERFVKEA